MTPHLYDLERLMDTAFGRMLSDIEFLPPDRCLREWADDYDEMLEHFVYGEHLAFADLLKRMAELQERF